MSQSARTVWIEIRETFTQNEKEIVTVCEDCVD